MADYPSDEFLQAQLEKSIITQCELHGWATAVSVADPLDILLMLEDEEIETDIFDNVVPIERAKS